METEWPHFSDACMLLSESHTIPHRIWSFEFMAFTYQWEIATVLVDNSNFRKWFFLGISDLCRCLMTEII